MKKIIVFFFASLMVGVLSAQPKEYTVKNIHSHNDYQQSIPLWQAISKGVGSVEADVFDVDNQLFVAHTHEEINKNTLESEYLEPIVNLVKDHKLHKLQLLVELKSECQPTLDLLISKLKNYPEVFNRDVVHVVVTGNIPAPEDFSKYDEIVDFDGDLDVNYTSDALKRVGVLSADLLKYTSWHGKENMVPEEKVKVVSLIEKAHALGKPVRFWDAGDEVNTWCKLMDLGVDFIGTDHVYECATFIAGLPKHKYQNAEFYVPYQPTYRNDDRLSRVKNIILLIGDGMGLAQWNTAYTANRGLLEMANFKNMGLIKTFPADDYVTDSAASGTAYAIGEKANNRNIGINARGEKRPDIPEIITKYGISSAVISAGDITDATPAVFYAHQPDRGMSEEIAADFLESPVSILIGGNPGAFSHRKDGRDLFPALRDKGYQIVTHFDSINEVRSDKMVILDDQSVVSMKKGRKDFLARSFTKAVETLSKKPQGFFMMLEGAQIDYGGHANDLEYVVRETLDFDQVVSKALQFADQNGETLVLVTADHETGGISLLDGNLKTGMILGNFSTNDHTAIMVPVLAYGPHSLDFRGTYENTELQKKIIAVFEKYYRSKR